MRGQTPKPPPRAARVTLAERPRYMGKSRLVTDNLVPRRGSAAALAAARSAGAGEADEEE